ncbi:MAG: hypothetical protein KIT22_11335, partial [Verrucomicrobiae bacterium]|nr:hypothetical protein [Verrucomicrobiae bacterium]
MPKNDLTPAQRRAVQKLIEAKSDREIARLLGLSYRLLGLHRRPRSCISHREPWTDYELRLLGRIRDEEFARRFGRGVRAVGAMRRSLGIPVFEPRRMEWSP